MSELPYYASKESAQYGNRIPNLVTGEWTTTEPESSAASGSTNSASISNGAKTQLPHPEKAESQLPTAIDPQDAFYPGCIHIREDSSTVALWHPEPRKRENIVIVPKTPKLQLKIPGSQVPSYPGYYQQLGCIPMAHPNRPNTTLCWNTNSIEGEHSVLALNIKTGSPTSSKTHQHGSFSPSISPTTSDAQTPTSPICPSYSTSPTSPISPTSPKRARLRAQLASAREQRRSLESDIASLSTALGIENPHDSGQWAALQEHLESQLQVIERQKEAVVALVAKGEKTEKLDMKIEVLKGALGEIDGDERVGKRRKMNEGILMGRIVKREVVGKPE